MVNMSSRRQQTARRSLSVFSLDHFRFLSRAASPSGQTSAVVHPSPLVQSCDPHQQSHPLSQPCTAVSTAVAKGSLTSPSKTADHLQPMTSPDHFRVAQRRHSWLSFSRPSFGKLPTRSFSVHTSKTTSLPSVTRSIISAPVLTCTTNMDVAEAEGVCCRDIVDAGLAIPLEEDEIRPRDFHSEEDAFRCKPPGRLSISSSSRVLRDNKEKVKSLMFDATLPRRFRDSIEGSWRLSSVEKSIARRRAEAMNLCREKINKLTGHGHIKRKSINKDSQNTSFTDLNPGTDDIIAQPHINRPDKKENQLLVLNHIETDSPSESLTKSFTSALDKLGSHQSPIADNMQFMKSKSSIFSLRKRTKTENKGHSDKHEEEKEPLVSEVQNEEQHKLQNPGMTMMEALKGIQPAPPIHEANIIGFPPEPMQFSASANGYVSAPPVPNYPKGVKVLGMHSNPMEFATAPDWYTGIAKSSNSKSRSAPDIPARGDVTETQDECEEDMIDDAPIYSPSLGNLSQYARPTPSPTKPLANVDQQEPETPTQSQAEKSYLRRLGLRKSKSGLSLLSVFDKGSKVHKSGTPLQDRNANQNTRTFQQLKKSRSLNLAGLLKKSDAATMTEPLLQEDKTTLYKPTNPSPLRHESQADDDTVTPSLDRSGAQKRTPPKGSVTSLDRAKRLGVIGMPRASFEKRCRDA